jgi:hypothetical protein
MPVQIPSTYNDPKLTKSNKYLKGKKSECAYTYRPIHAFLYTATSLNVEQNHKATGANKAFENSAKLKYLRKTTKVSRFRSQRN